MLRKIVFLEQFFGIAVLYIDQQQAKSLGVSSGDLHGTYVKRTKPIQFVTKTKVRFWRPAWASKFHGLRLRRMRKVLKSVFPF